MRQAIRNGLSTMGLSLVALTGIMGTKAAHGQAPEYEVRLALIDELGARAMGMGGAFTGLADDANAGLTNPAGLATLPKALDSALSGTQRTDTDGGRQRRLVPAWFGAALHPWRDFGFGVGFVGVRQSEIHSLSNGSTTLRLVDPFPLSVAVRPKGGLIALGATRRFSSLSACPNNDCGGFKNFRSDNHHTWRLGAMLLPNPQIRVGLVYQQAQRFVIGNEAGAPLRLHVRTPEIWSFGLSWRADLEDSSRILVSSQTDLLRDRAPHTDRHTLDAEWRTGLEWSHPFNCFAGCGSLVQVRVGLHYDAARPVGMSLGAPSTPSTPRLAWSGGASLALQKMVGGRLRLDTGVVRGQRGVSILLALNFRYSESYRGDLRYRRRSDAASREDGGRP